MKLDTVCRLCSACCPVTAEVKDGKLLGAQRKSFLPQDKRLLCPKLQAAPEIVYSPERVLKPLIRRKGASGNGFQEATWDAALDLVARSVVEVWPLEPADVQLARQLHDQFPELDARDLCYFASCRRRGVGEIKTFDRGLSIIADRFL